METASVSPFETLLGALREDARLAHALRFPERSPTWFSWLRVLFGARGLKVLAVARLDQACSTWRPASLGGRLARRVLLLVVNVGNRLNNIVAKSEVTVGTFEGGVYLADGGHIIVGVRTLGSGTIIHDHVTIGRGVRLEDVPRIGRRVWVGPHCVIFGKIEVGDGVTVLPHSVLSRNIPPNTVVQGNPAQIVRRDFDNSSVRRGLETDWSSLQGQEASSR
jgi:serine acetyltransferase